MLHFGNNADHLSYARLFDGASLQIYFQSPTNYSVSRPISSTTEQHSQVIIDALLKSPQVKDINTGRRANFHHTSECCRKNVVMLWRCGDERRWKNLRNAAYSSSPMWVMFGYWNVNTHHLSNSFATRSLYFFCGSLLVGVVVHYSVSGLSTLFKRASNLLQILILCG